MQNMISQPRIDTVKGTMAPVQALELCLAVLIHFISMLSGGSHIFRVFSTPCLSLRAKFSACGNWRSLLNLGAALSLYSN